MKDAICNNVSFQKSVWEDTWSNFLSKKIYPELSDYELGWNKSLVELLNQEINFKNYKNILECGCGNGIFSLEIVNKFPHLRLVLSDISKVALIYSRKLLIKCREVRNKENFLKITPRYQQDDMFDLRHGNNVFDFVINGGAIEHYNDKEIRLLITEMLRVVASGGVLVVVVPNLRNIDINIYKTKLLIKKFTNNKLFRNMTLYGASDERNIPYKKLCNITKNISGIKNLKYFPHPIALPRFIQRNDGRLFRCAEKMLVKLGLNWANVYIINKI